MKRLGLARDLQQAQADVVKAKAAGDNGAAIVGARLVSAVRATLLGRRSAGAEGIDVMDPLDAAERAAGHMQALRDSGAPADKVIEDSLILQPVIRFAASVAAQAKLPDQQIQTALASLVTPQSLDEFHIAKLDQFTSASTVVAENLDLLEETSAKYAEAVKAEDEAMAELNDEIRAEQDALKERMRPGQPGGATYAEYHDAHYELVDQLKDRQLLAKHTRAGNLTKAGIGYMRAGQALISACTEASPVTEEQASTWAAQQEITKQAAARLKKNGYPVDQVRADMAEFHRLTGGRLGTVKINTNGSTRANATGIHGHESAVINIDSNFNKRVLWHEMGHHLEADPAVLAAAKGFLKRKSDGTGLHSMQSLTGSKFYRPNEQAYRDHFFTHYVGKHYNDATEVMSMAVESLSDIMLLGQRMAADPDIFRLLEGVMKTPVNKLMKLVHDVRAQNADVQAEFQEAQADTREILLKTVASRVELSSTMPEVNPAALELLTGYFGRIYKLGGFVGAHIARDTAYLVYQAGKVTEYLTGFDKTRPKKGYLIAAVSVADRDDFMGNSSVQRCGVIGDLDEVRARIYQWEKTGITPLRKLTVESLKTYAA